MKRLPHILRLRMDNKTYLGLLISLLILWGASELRFLQLANASTSPLFELDTAALQAIHLNHPKDSCTLSRTPLNQWRINNEHRGDPFLLATLQHILLHANSKRELQRPEKQQINSLMTKEGCHLTAFNHQGKNLLVATLWGNPQTQKTYVKLSNSIYELYLQGEAAYLGGIFFLRAIQWRDRLLFNSNAFTLQSLSFQDLSTPENSFLVNIEAQTPQLAPLAHQSDTAKLYDYLSNFESFYTNEYIAIHNHAHYDSLRKYSTAGVRIQIKDLYAHASKEVTIYEDPTSNYFLLEERQQHDTTLHYSLCEQRRLQPLMKARSYFTIQSPQ